MTKEQKALKFLFNSETYPGLIQRNASDAKLILWKNNTLGDYFSWTVFESEEKCYIRQIIWKQHTAYNLKEPETYGSEIMISREMMNFILQTFKNIDPNIFKARQSISIDGIRFGIVSQEQHIELGNAYSSKNSELGIKFQEIVEKFQTTYFHFFL